MNPHPPPPGPPPPHSFVTNTGQSTNASMPLYAPQHPHPHSQCYPHVYQHAPPQAGPSTAAVTPGAPWGQTMFPAHPPPPPPGPPPLSSRGVLSESHGQDGFAWGGEGYSPSSSHHGGDLDRASYAAPTPPHGQGPAATGSSFTTHASDFVTMPDALSGQTGVVELEEDDGFTVSAFAEKKSASVAPRFAAISTSSSGGGSQPGYTLPDASSSSSAITSTRATPTYLPQTPSTTTPIVSFSSSPSPQEQDQNAPLPEHAPRLVVPDDLPLDQIALLDLVAVAVVAGGPTVEEELVLRETPSKYNNGVGNEAFSFLHAPLSDPRMRYYRWRVYSLLQGDSLMVWRTEPFQMESSADAYVWVPPAALCPGPECLRGLWDALEEEEEEEGETAASGKSPSAISATRMRRKTASVLGPSAAWMTRLCGEMNTVMSFLTPSEEATWRALLDPTQVLTDTPASEVRGEVENDAVAAAATAGAKDSGENVRAPTTARRSRKRQRIVEVGLESLSSGDGQPPPQGDDAFRSYQNLFRREVIEERMLFALDHVSASVHVLSILLDALIGLAQRAVRASKEKRDDDNAKGVKGPDDAFMHCHICVWYLFILHDIINNGGITQPMLEAELQTRYENEHSDRGETDGRGFSTTTRTRTMDAPRTSANDTGKPDAPSPVSQKRCANTKGIPFMVLAAEMVLPTVIEVCTLVALVALGETVYITRSDPPSTALVLLEDELDERLTDPTAAEFTAPIASARHGPPRSAQPMWCAVESTRPLSASTETQSRARAHGAGLLLLSWVNTLFPMWFGHQAQRRRGQKKARMPEPVMARPQGSSPSAATTKTETTLREDVVSDEVGVGHGGLSGAHDASAPALFRGSLRSRLKVVLGEKYAFLLSGQYMESMTQSAGLHETPEAV